MHSIQVVGSSLSVVIDKLNEVIRRRMPLGCVILNIDFELRPMQNGSEQRMLVLGEVKVAFSRGNYPDLYYEEGPDIDSIRSAFRIRLGRERAETMVYKREYFNIITQTLPSADWACEVSNDQLVEVRLQTVWVVF